MTNDFEQNDNYTNALIHATQANSIISKSILV